MAAWKYIVRSALRIKDGLAALSTSQIQGNIAARCDIALDCYLENEVSFRLAKTHNT
jgi:hypothetical protein